MFAGALDTVIACKIDDVIFRLGLPGRRRRHGQECIPDRRNAFLPRHRNASAGRHCCGQERISVDRNAHAFLQTAFLSTELTVCGRCQTCCPQECAVDRNALSILETGCLTPTTCCRQECIPVDRNVFLSIPVFHARSPARK